MKSLQWGLVMLVVFSKLRFFRWGGVANLSFCVLGSMLLAGLSPVKGDEATARDVTGPYFVEASQDPKPEGKQWRLVDDLSDEFDGQQINAGKWQTKPRGNGFAWMGRPPGLFRADNVKLDDGHMKVTVSVLPEPRTIRGQKFLYQGAIVRSLKPGHVGWYYETRMKANQTEMSSTFWLISKGGSQHRQELDIQECVGTTSDLTERWGRNWNQVFHSNLIRRERGVEGKVQIQGSIKPPTRNYERFYVYGAWWKSPREVQFFLDGKYAYSLTPDVDWNIPAHLHMAIETYDWNPVPEGGGLVSTGTQEQRTTQYDWVRVWKLK